MRVRILSLTVILIGLCSAEEPETSTSAFDEVLGKSQACKDACERTYPLHTYDTPSNLDACNRGCRLFSICEWSNDDKDFNRTLEECSAACGEAYNGTAQLETESCKVGCSSAVSPARKRKTMLQEEPHVRIIISESYSSPRLFWKDPFDGVFPEFFKHPFSMSSDNLMQNMFNRMSQLVHSDFMTSSLMSLGNRDSDEIMIIRFNSPEINTQHPLDKQVKQNTDGNKINLKTTLVDRIIESNLQTNLYEKNHPFTDDYWFSDYYDDLGAFEVENSFKDQFHDWWNCFVKKAGLPEIALLIFWISTMILLLMCCVVQFPSKSKSSKLSISGDLAYIKESKGRVPEFLRVYGHPGIVRFTELKHYKPDEKIPLSESF